VWSSQNVSPADQCGVGLAPHVLPNVGTSRLDRSAGLRQGQARYAMGKKKLSKSASPKGSRPIIGWRERVDLPGLKVFGLNAKVDTGAKTSSLHVDEVSALSGSKGASRLRVVIAYADERGIERTVRCDVQGSGMRRVKSSTGHTEQRHVIVTMLRLGTEEYPIEITLSDRSDMAFPMLIGRGALRKRFLVDCGRSFLQSKATRAVRAKRDRTHGEEE